MGMQQVMDALGYATDMPFIVVIYFLKVIITTTTKCYIIILAGTARPGKLSKSNIS